MKGSFPGWRQARILSNAGRRKRWRECESESEKWRVRDSGKNAVKAEISKLLEEDYEDLWWGFFSQTSQMIFVKLIQSWTSAARFKKLISFCLFFSFTHLWTILFNHLENNKTIGVTLHYLVHKLVLVQEIDGKLPPGVTKCHRAFLDAVLDCVTWPHHLCEILSCNPDIQTSRHSAAVSSYLDFLNHSGVFVFCRRLPS